MRLKMLCLPILQAGVTLEHFFAIDLITAKKVRKLGVRIDGNGDHVLGLYLFDANRDRVITVSAPVVLLATVCRTTIFCN